MKYNCTDAAALSINDDDEIKSVERQDINGNYLHQIFLFLNISLELKQNMCTVKNVSEIRMPFII